MTQGLVEGIGGFLRSDFVVKTADYQLVAGDKVIADSASRLNFTLPPTVVAGQIFAIAMAPSSGGWKIVQQTGQAVRLPDGTITTGGGSGYLQSDHSLSTEYSAIILYVNSATSLRVIAIEGRIATDLGTVYGPSKSATANTVAQRTTGGALVVGAPTSSDHAIRLADLGGQAYDLLPDLSGARHKSVVTRTNNISAVWSWAESATTLHVVFMEDTSLRIFYIKSTDGGETYTSPLDISGFNCEANFRTALYRNGNTLVVIFQRTSDFDIYAVISTDNGGSWGSPAVIESLAASARFGALVGTGADLYMFYFTSTGVSSCKKSSDTGSTWGTTRTVDATSNNNSFASGWADFQVVSANEVWALLEQSSTASGGSRSTRLLKTTDGNGSNWTTVNTIYDGLSTASKGGGRFIVSGTLVSYWEGSTNNGSNVWHRSTDSGTTLTSMGLGPAKSGSSGSDGINALGEAGANKLVRLSPTVSLMAYRNTSGDAAQLGILAVDNSPVLLGASIDYELFNVSLANSMTQSEDGSAIFIVSVANQNNKLFTVKLGKIPAVLA